jgi:hypothetical protein
MVRGPARNSARLVLDLDPPQNVRGGSPPEVNTGLVRGLV